MSRKARKVKKERFALPPRMTDAQLIAFVKAWLSGQVTTSRHVPENLLGMVFMPLALGALAGATKKQIDEIGLIWAHNEKDTSISGRAINGFRIFASCRLMLKVDWEIARATLLRESERPTPFKLEKP